MLERKRYEICATWSFVFRAGNSAKSIWNGKSGYQVSVALYQCQNIRDSYHKVDTDYGDIGARAIGSVSGVWKYKSEHGVRSNRNSKISRVCELTDW